MLSSQEERVWDEIQRYWSDEAEEPRRPRRSSRVEAELPIAVAVGARVVIVLLLFGAAPAALAVAAATALGWVLWRHRPQPSVPLISSPQTGTDRAACRQGGTS